MYAGPVSSGVEMKTLPVNCELFILGRLNESTGEVGHAPVFSIVLPESFEPFVKLAGVRGVRGARSTVLSRYIPDPSLKRQTPRAAQVSIFGPGHFAQPFCPTVRMPFPPRREPPRAQISTK